MRDSRFTAFPFADASVRAGAARLLPGHRAAIGLIAIALFVCLTLAAPALAAVPGTGQTLLTAASPASGANFGSAVAVSGDGSTLVVGARGVSGGGQATVYTCSAATCASPVDLRVLVSGSTSVTDKSLTSNVATLTTSAAHGYVVGESVVVASVDSTFNGTYTITTVPSATTFTYARSASNVTSTSASGSASVTLVSSSAKFGTAVDVSDDGSRVLVTAPYNSVGGSSRGSAFMFAKSGGSWTYEGRLLETTPTTNNLFGRSGALSGDGTTVAVGADQASGQTGVVAVFTRSGSVWSLKQTITGQASCSSSCSGYAASTYYDQLGYAVDLSDNGNTLLVSAVHQGSTYLQMGAGAAYVYTRVDPAAAAPWDVASRKTLLMSDNSGTARGINDAFGWAIALSSDGTTAAVLDWQTAYKTHIFVLSGGNWSRQASVQATTQGFREGGDVALSGDGNTLLVGLNEDDATYTDQGTVAFFTRSGSTWSQSGGMRTQASGAEANNYFGSSVDIATAGDGLAAVGAFGDGHSSISAGWSGPGSVTLFTPSLSSDVLLSGLLVSSGSLSPGFASGTTAYAVAVANGVSSLTVTPTVNQAGASVQVRVASGSWVSVSSGSASAGLALSVGANTVEVKVTAQDGTTTATTTLTVTRAAADTPPAENQAPPVQAQAQVEVQAPAPVSPPAPKIEPPSLTGATEVGGLPGSTLVVVAPVSCDPGTWPGATSHAYTWWRGDTPIPGATGPSYLPGPRDIGFTVFCKVTATGPAGERLAASDTLRVVVAEAVSPVALAVRHISSRWSRDGSGRFFYEFDALDVAYFRLSPDGGTTVWDWRRLLPAFSVGAGSPRLWVQVLDTSGRLSAWKPVAG